MGVSRHIGLILPSCRDSQARRQLRPRGGGDEHGGLALRQGQHRADLGDDLVGRDGEGILHSRRVGGLEGLQAAGIGLDIGEEKDVQRQTDGGLGPPVEAVLARSTTWSVAGSESELRRVCMANAFSTRKPSAVRTT